MIKKPFEFKPTLSTPRGINNYSGAVFRCFTKGDTLPFRFTLKSSDNVISDFTGYQVFVSYSDALNAERGECNGDQNLLEVEIPLVDAAGGVFEGEVLGLESQSLSAGITYGMVRFVTSTGVPFIIDMAALEVYPNLTTINK